MIKEKAISAFLEEVKPLRILLVDDDMASQFVIAKSLFNLGNNLDICSSSDEAMRRIKTFDYDLIMVDLNLPVVNGFDLSKSIKYSHQNSDFAPIIFGLTGLDHPLLPILISYSDIDDYIIRSFDYGDLISKIVNHCYLHQN